MFVTQYLEPSISDPGSSFSSVTCLHFVLFQHPHPLKNGDDKNAYVMKILRSNKLRLIKNIVICSADSVYSSDVIFDAYLFFHFIFFTASLLYHFILYSILRILIFLSFNLLEINSFSFMLI